MKDGCVKARKIHKTQPKKVEFQPTGKVAKYPKLKNMDAVFSKNKKPGHLT